MNRGSAGEFLKWNVMPQIKQPTLEWWFIYPPGSRFGEGTEATTDDLVDLYQAIQTRLIQAGRLEPGHYPTPTREL